MLVAQRADLVRRRGLRVRKVRVSGGGMTLARWRRLRGLEVGTLCLWCAPHEAWRVRWPGSDGLVRDL